MRVFNYGSLNLDYVYRVSHMVRGGETLAAAGMEIYLGGKGLNQSVALARAGVPVCHAGCVGEDGHVLTQYLDSQGVDTSLIRTINGKSGHTIIQVDDRAQNAILVYGGANHKQTREQIRQTLDTSNSGDILMLQNEINESVYLMEEAKRRGLRLVVNPSPMDEQIRHAPLETADYILINETEGNAISGQREASAILDWFSVHSPKTAVLLTLGEAGAVYQDGKGRIAQKAFSVVAVDTTAAGDTFTGYFVAGLVRGMEMEEILRQCAAASALAVTRNGAAPSIPSKEEVDRFLTGR